MLFRSVEAPINIPTPTTAKKMNASAAPIQGFSCFVTLKASRICPNIVGEFTLQVSQVRQLEQARYRQVAAAPNVRRRDYLDTSPAIYGAFQSSYCEAGFQLLPNYLLW